MPVINALRTVDASLCRPRSERRNWRAAYDILSSTCKRFARAVSGRASQSGPPVIEDVAQGLLERDRGLPAHRAQRPGRIAAQDGHVGRPQARGVFLYADALHAGFAEEEVEDVSDDPRA